MPTIRVDDDVYAWLQQQARPFEDTPNSVLRRIAEIPSASASTGTTSEPQLRRSATQSTKEQRAVSGRQLNALWGVGARHALYNRDGCWYNNLERFPGALFDPQGYILFETEEAYRNSRHLRISQKTNVPKGISSIPGYVRMKG